MNDVIHDRFGRPCLILDSNGDFLLYNGQHIGFLQGSGVYNYRGRQVGWLEGGVLRDLTGNTAGFGDNPKDFPAPFFPLTQLPPIPGIPHIPPIRPITEIEHLRPLKTFTWSALNPVSLFGSR